jgi:hypothetical protein
MLDQILITENLQLLVAVAVTLVTIAIPQGAQVSLVVATTTHSVVEKGVQVAVCLAITTVTVQVLLVVAELLAVAQTAVATVRLRALLLPAKAVEAHQAAVVINSLLFLRKYIVI